MGTEEFKRPEIVRPITKERLEEFKNSISQMDPKAFEEKDDSYRAYLFLLVASDVGTDLFNIAQSMGEQVDDTLRSFHTRALSNGLFKDGIIYHSGWLDDGEAGGINFILDAMMIMGLVKREPTKNKKGKKNEINN